MGRRMIYRRILIICLLAIIVIPRLHAQSFSTHLYTTTDGLPDNFILCLYQDSFGYLWMGTTNGLCRFDGKQFTTIGRRQGLPSVVVNSIFEDKQHRLWIGTRGGIAELRGDSCYTYPVSDGLPLNYISGFLQRDSSELWVATNAGLYEFRKNAWTKISLLPGYENRYISSILQSSRGLLLNYENRKLIEWTPGGRPKTLLSLDSGHYYNSLYAFGDSIFVGSYSGLSRLNGRQWFSLFPDSLQKRHIFHSYRDRNYRWWFGTKEDGILMTNGSANKLSYLRIPLPVNLVSQFMEDREGNIWVASYQGLLKVSPVRYRTFSRPEFDSMGFIRNCIATPSGRLIVSGENGRLLTLERSADDLSLKRLRSYRLKRPNEFLDLFVTDEKQRLWFTTRSGELYRLDDTALRNFSSIIPCRNCLINALAYNKSTHELFVGADAALLKGDEHRLDTFFIGNNKKTLPLASAIFIDEKNECMLVQADKTLYSIRSDASFVDLGQKIDLSKAVMSYDSVRKETLLWTENEGLNLAKYSLGRNAVPKLLEFIDAKDGLPGDKIQSMAFGDDRLWLATTRSVIGMQKKKNGSWTSEDLISDAAPSELAFSNFTRDREGHIWMNTKNRLLMWDFEIPVHPVSTTTMIEKVWLNNTPTDWRSQTVSPQGYRQLPVDAKLAWDQNTLTISFNAIQFSQISQLEYSYRLFPSDTSWGKPIQGNIVSFYALNPGSYYFEVKSRVKGSEWSKPAWFAFTIKKPFWGTWWFRLMEIILGATLLVSIFRYRLQRLKARNQIQNRLRELETKALRLQMNPHFIYNALNSIQSLVMNGRNNEASHYIGKFARLLRQILENSDLELVYLENELYSLQLYVELEQWRMNCTIDYQVIDDSALLRSAVRIPPLVLQPFVENALWHGLSKKDGEKKIDLVIAEDKQYLVVRIIDNGIGRDLAAASYRSFPEGHLSKAVTIIRQRLTEFNRPLSDDPVVFMDLMENGRPSGTEVVLKIKLSQ